MPVDIFKQKLQRSGRTEQHIKTQCRRSKRELEEKCITIKVLKDELNMILNDNRSRGRSVFGESCGDSHALKGLKKELKEVRHLVEGLEIKVIEIEVDKSRLITLIELDKSNFGSRRVDKDSNLSSNSNDFSEEAQKRVEASNSRLSNAIKDLEFANSRIKQLEQEISNFNQFKSSIKEFESKILQSQQLLTSLSKSISTLRSSQPPPSSISSTQEELTNVQNSKSQALHSFKSLHKSTKDYEALISMINQKNELAVQDVIDSNIEQIDELDEVSILQDRELSGLKIKLKPARIKNEELKIELSSKKKIFRELEELVRTDKSRTKRINSNISQLNSQLIRARKELQLIESKSLTTPPNQSSSNSIASALTDVILEIPIESEISSMLDQVEGLRSSYDELREKEDCVERKLTLLKESKKQEIIANWNGESRRSLERIQVLESKVSELSKKSSNPNRNPPQPSSLSTPPLSKFSKPSTSTQIELIQNLKKRVIELNNEVSLLWDENFGLYLVKAWIGGRMRSSWCFWWSL